MWILQYRILTADGFSRAPVTHSGLLYFSRPVKLLNGSCNAHNSSAGFKLELWLLLFNRLCRNLKLIDAALLSLETICKTKHMEDGAENRQDEISVSRGGPIFLMWQEVLWQSVWEYLVFDRYCVGSDGAVAFPEL